MNPSLAPASLAEPHDREQQALEWFARVRANDFSPDERETFEQWRSDPANARTLSEVQLLWQQLELAPRRVRRTPTRTVARPWRG